MSIDATEVTAWWEGFKRKLDHVAHDATVRHSLLFMLRTGLQIVEPMIDSALIGKGVNPKLVAAGEDLANKVVNSATED